ncbi:MAG: type II secretion system F family protein [Pararoseburia sp.]|nr:type II secretion system F family protein [Pararoseburia sp.]
MAEFTYVAMNEAGKRVKGNVLAENETLALEKLRLQDLYPTKLVPANIFNKEIDISIGKVATSRDLSVFCRQFVSMLSAGITIVTALEMLADQTENKHLARALRKVQEDIMQGETLADAMRKHKKIFPELMINMVTAGEAAGKLDVTFSRMADHFEKAEKTEGMMKKAAIYPVMVAVVAIVVVVIMLIKVVPAYADMFASMDVEMPGITLAVMNASDFMTHYWYVLLAIIVMVVAVGKAYKNTEDGKLAAGRMAISVPLFGKLKIKTISSLTARTLSTLIYSGMPLVDGLRLTARTVGNELYKRALEQAVVDVREGMTLSSSLKKSSLYPPMVSHMIGIGEETGELEDMLTKLADYYDTEVEMTTQTVMAALEPMIILIMAALVGIVIAACMAPMISMYSNMGNL